MNKARSLHHLQSKLRRSHLQSESLTVGLLPTGHLELKVTWYWTWGLDLTGVLPYEKMPMGWPIGFTPTSGSSGEVPAIPRLTVELSFFHS